MIEITGLDYSQRIFVSRPSDVFPLVAFVEDLIHF